MEQIRKAIDDIDLQIKNLVLRRMDCSYKVAQAKNAAGSTEIYRADREASILEKLAYGVPSDRLPEYLSLVRKVMETSRMYQYGLLYDWNENAFDMVEGCDLCEKPSSRVLVRLSRPNQPNAMSAILCMIGDYGFNMQRMELLEESEDLVSFDLTIRGDVTKDAMRKLLFQLSKESATFKVLGVE